MDKPETVKIDIWKLYFNGDFSKEGVGASIVLISLDKENITQSYKLEFDFTNNVAKYEALLLGLELAKSLKIQNLSVLSDSELIVKQVRNIFQTKDPDLDLLEMRYGTQWIISFRHLISLLFLKMRIFMQTL